MTTKLRRHLAGWLQARWYASRAPWFLLPLADLFGALAALRRTLYTHGWLRPVRVPARVVVIGNITVGGSGKTPLVAWLAEQLSAEGVKVGIVTRGYGGSGRETRLVEADATAAEVGDEVLWLARHTAVPVAVGRDRAATARHLTIAARPDVILADDGLQHYRLARDVEIAAVDTRRGIGNGALLPAGPLREKPSRLARVDAIVMKGEGGPPLPAGVPVFTMDHALADAVSLVDGATVSLSVFHDQTVVALAAIADPEGFFGALEAAGLGIERHPLPDHAPIAETLASLGTERPVLMTDKDAMRLAGVPPNTWRVPLAVGFSAQDAARLLALVRGANPVTEET